MPRRSVGLHRDDVTTSADEVYEAESKSGEFWQMRGRGIGLVLRLLAGEGGKGWVTNGDWGLGGLGVTYGGGVTSSAGCI